MKKVQFSERPSLVSNEGQGVLICFGVEEVEVVQQAMDGGEEEIRVPMFEAFAVRVEHPVTRSRVVDAIVTSAYPSDVMQAVINNHLLGDDDAEHEAEFAAMQEWRVLAKSTADNVLAVMRG